MADLPLADAARRAGASPVTLRKAAARGELVARKLAGRWITSDDDLAAYLRGRRRRGRPSAKMEIER